MSGFRRHRGPPPSETGGGTDEYTRSGDTGRGAVPGGEPFSAESGVGVVRWTRCDSPMGPLPLTADASGALTSLSVPGQKGSRQPSWTVRPDPGPFREAERQLAAYFAGEPKEFTLPLRTDGTAFRERVWAALDAVPYGATTTYGAIAARVGASRAAVLRAVGGAIGANPLL